jgi:hypothetical protein
MLGKHLATELHVQPWIYAFLCQCSLQH